MFEDIRPHGNRLLAKIITEETTSKSGLIQTANSNNKWATVLAVDEEAETAIEKGDLVFFSLFQSVEVDPQDVTLILVKLDDVLAYKKSVTDDLKEDVSVLG
jgi:co-chaperonin GroES (HSP10)